MDIIEKYSQVYWSPYLVWVFMWVNAIKDIALYVDWPDCVFWKADFIYKTHDLNSKLKGPNINTKLYFSWVMPNKMVREYDDKIKRKLSFIVDNDYFSIWVVTCMPVTWLLATQYNNIYNELKKDFIFIPSFTDKFRLDWYATFLKELAKFIKLDSTKEKIKLNISIIWYLFDRNEWDCISNIEEIKRILGLLWIKVNSVWLSWDNYNDLKSVENSELIVLLPYWKQAWNILSKKLWIDCIETEVPFWLKNTIEFVKKISDKLWIEKTIVDSILRSEVEFSKWKIDLLDEKKFLNKNYIYAWDPFLEDSIKDIGDFLWMNHIKTYSYTWTKQGKIEDFDWKNIDIVIWNSEFNINLQNCTMFEFWFPSYNNHFLIFRPYMGFRGLIYFIESLYNRISYEKSLFDRLN